jgi:hypothetical protein
MPSPRAANIPVTMRQKMFWALIATLAVGQLAAIWMLCSYQVRQAQAREATVQVDRMALADCLRSGPASTPRHCASRLAAARHDPHAVLAATENTANFSVLSAPPGRAAHVNFSLR